MESSITCEECGETGKDCPAFAPVLWPDGPSIALCAAHFRELRKTSLLPPRKLAPPGMNPELRYDFWGNIVLGTGARYCGLLFNDPEARQALADVGDLFQKYVKYPRTYHLPGSPGTTSDDRILADSDGFEVQEVIVTLKMDGESCTMYDDHTHARSINSANHPSRDWVRRLQGALAADIPAGWRLCGENLYARHSIVYDDLESYFLAFSIWDDANRCLPWNETLEWFTLLGVASVPVIWEGQWDAGAIQQVFDSRYSDGNEGYVVRRADGFHYATFFRHCAKWVRKNHVQTNQHWLHGEVTPNTLRDQP